MEIRFLGVTNFRKQSRAQKTFQTHPTTKNDWFSSQNLQIVVRSWVFRYLISKFIRLVLAAQEELDAQILNYFYFRNTLSNFCFNFGKSHVEFWVLVSSDTDNISGEWTTECRWKRPKSNRWLLKSISRCQVTQMLSETVSRIFIRSISWEEIEF